MYCPKCGIALPEGSHFCPNCGNQIQKSKINNSGLSNNPSMGKVQSLQSNTTYATALAKFKSQIKLGFLLDIICNGIAILYVLLTPDYKFYVDSLTMEVLCSVIAFAGFGALLLVICCIVAAKGFNFTLKQIGISKTTDLPQGDQSELKHCTRTYAAISMSLTMASILLVLFRYFG